jgi:hypothetical protein
MPAEKTLTKIGILDHESATADFHGAEEGHGFAVAGQTEADLEREKEKQRPEHQKCGAARDEFPLFQGVKGWSRIRSGGDASRQRTAANESLGADRAEWKSFMRPLSLLPCSEEVGWRLAAVFRSLHRREASVVANEM